MTMYSRHYTVDEANALLPTLRGWIERMWQLDDELAPLADGHSAVLARAESHNVGGRQLGQWASLSMEWRRLANQFTELGIELKDLAKGLCDFPHLRPDGEEVFLCWRVDEPQVGHWHTLEGGFASRQPL